jgi:hypothetical protein
MVEDQLGHRIRLLHVREVGCRDDRELRGGALLSPRST